VIRLVGALVVAYAGMVVLGAWIAHEMNKNRGAFSV
jgi:hypothetical protein